MKIVLRYFPVIKRFVICFVALYDCKGSPPTNISPKVHIKRLDNYAFAHLPKAPEELNLPRRRNVMHKPVFHVSRAARLRFIRRF